MILTEYTRVWRIFPAITTSMVAAGFVENEETFTLSAMSNPYPMDMGPILQVNWENCYQE
jgi:hypothetical protein